MRRLRPKIAPLRDLGHVDRPQVGGTDRTVQVGQGGMRVFAVAVLVAAVVAVTSVVRLHHSAAVNLPGPTGAPTHAVIVLIDGTQPADLAAPDLPNLARLARLGVVYNSAWVGQLQADPASSAATLGTGVFPREHGIVGPTWTDPQSGQPTNALTPLQIHLGSLDQLLESRNVPSVSGALKQQDASQKVLAVGGVGCGAAAAAATWLADYVLCPARDGNRWGPAAVTGHATHNTALQSLAWVRPVATGRGLAPHAEGWQLGAQDAWVGRYTVAAMRALAPTVTIVDFPEVGLVARYLSASQRPRTVGRIMRGVDHALGGIIAELHREKVYSRTVFVITSPFPTAPFSGAVPRSAIDSAVSASGGQEVYATTDGAAMIGLGDPTQGQPLAQTLQSSGLASADAIFFKSHGGLGWSYQIQYLNPGLPAGFGDAVSYLVGTMASDVSPEVVVAYAPHVGTATNFAGFTREESTIGLQWDTQQIPLILSGDGIFQGGSSDFPARLVDVAPTLEALFGIRPSSTDGAVLADAMLYPPSGSADAQNAERHAMEPLVTALKRRYASAPG